MNKILLLKNGDETVFKQVYDLLHPKLFRFFLKRNLSHDNARELTQNTFIKLWQCRVSLTDHATLDTQVFTIARSVMIDQVRRRKHRKALYSSLAAYLETDETLKDLFPHQSFEQDNYLDTAIRSLSPVRKKVVSLRLNQGMTNKEVASNLSIHVKTVEDHITKAIRQVRAFHVTDIK